MNIMTPVRHKTLAEIARQCKRQKVPYREGEFVVVVGMPGRGTACYDPFTGRFYGHTHKGVFFDSKDSRHDITPWKKALRVFFHQEIRE